MIAADIRSSIASLASTTAPSARGRSFNAARKAAHADYEEIREDIAAAADLGSAQRVALYRAAGDAWRKVDDAFAARFAELNVVDPFALLAAVGAL